MSPPGPPTMEQVKLDPGVVYPRAGWLRHVPAEMFTIRLRDGRSAEVMNGPDGRTWLEMPEPDVPRRAGFTGVSAAASP